MRIPAALCLAAVLAACAPEPPPDPPPSDPPARDPGQTTAATPAPPPPTLGYPPLPPPPPVDRSLASFCRPPGPGLPKGSPLPRPAGAAVAPRQVWEAAETGFRSAARCVIRTANEWAAVQRTGSMSKAPPRPVDFSRSALLLVAWGEESSAFHRIWIDSVYVQGGQTFARVQTFSPAIVGDMPTEPVAVFEIPRRTGEIVFVESAHEREDVPEPFWFW